MKALLLQLDGGTFPNLALMRLSGRLKCDGHEVEFRRAQSVASVTPGMFDDWGKVYASAIFKRTQPLVEALRHAVPEALIGGTGTESPVTLEDMQLGGGPLDYSIYPAYPHSLGFSQRGCRLRCGFCVVPQKEGAVRAEATIAEIWRGAPYPRNVCLLDNDFFGQPQWRERLEEIRAGKFRVCFTQGINVRLVTEEIAEALASVRYSDDSFTRPRLYTAWDNRKDEARLFAGLERLARAGIKPDHIMVYMLIGYWAGETHADRDYRRRRLREFGCRPYPMPFVRTPELIGFQRWVIRRADVMCSWRDFMGAAYDTRNMKSAGVAFPLFDG